MHKAIVYILKSAKLVPVKDSDLANETRNGPCGVCATREAEQEDFVVFFPVVCDEPVRFANVVVQAASNSAFSIE
jgi:hypothetical protein